MQGSTRIVVLGAILGLAALALVSQFVMVRETGWQRQLYTANTDELTGTALVGQTFVAEQDNLSAVSVMFATYSNRRNTQPVKFHLRASTTDQTDIRQGTVHPSALGDNQLYRFTFEPIPDSGGKAYFFFVTSPASEPGNAVTVDIDTRDPYHLGTAYIVREVSDSDDPRILARSGKQTVDVSFALHYSVPLREAIINQARDGWRWFMSTWNERQSLYWLWLKLALPVMTFIGLLVWVGSEKRGRILVTPWGRAVVLAGLVIAAILWRLMYATELPVTNDEGNYLYDARTLLEGRLAGGDGYVKAPLVIAWLTLWEWLMGATIIAGRMSSIVAGALTLVPLYVIGRYMWNEKTGLLAAAAWGLFGAPAVFNIYVHTQPVAMFWGISGVAVLWWVLRTTREGRGEILYARRWPWTWYVVAGVLLGLGVASRKSILALGLLPLLLIAIESQTWRERGRRTLWVGAGFLAVIVVFLGLAIAVYGCDSPLFLLGEGRCMAVEEALGINSAEDGLTAVDPAEMDQVRAYSLRGMTPFFRESLPLILLALIGWGIALERLGRQVIRSALKQSPSPRVLGWLDQVAPKTLWLPAWIVFAWAWSFFWEYEGGVFVSIGGMQWLWWLIGFTLAVIMLVPRRYENRFMFDEPQEDVKIVRSQQPQFQKEHLNDAAAQTDIIEPWRSWPALVVGVLLPALWIGGLAFFYMNWIKFHANYIVEFLPPLAVMSGAGVYWAWRRLQVRGLAYARPMLDVTRQAVKVLLLLAVVWSLYLSNYITFVFEHTGTFNQGSAEQAAEWAQQHIPLDQPIFTGAALIPYLSGHRTALDIAHPRWYAYEFTRKDTERLNTFLPPAEELVAAFREAQWVLLESQTGFSFLMEYSEIEAGLERDFERVEGIENGSNTLTFYRRIRAAGASTP